MAFLDRLSEALNSKISNPRNCDIIWQDDVFPIPGGPLHTKTTNIKEDEIILYQSINQLTKHPHLIKAALQFKSPPPPPK